LNYYSFWEKSNERWQPPRDRSVVNIINFVATLLVAVIVWLMNEMLNDLAMNVIVDVRIEYTAKYRIHMLMPPSIAVSIQPV
jgi:hypothetical protein